MKTSKLILTSLFLMSSSLSLANDCPEDVAPIFASYKVTFKGNHQSTSVHLNRLNENLSQAKGECKSKALIILAYMSATEILANNTSAIAREKIHYLISYMVKNEMVDILNKESMPLLKDKNILGAYSCKENKIWLSADNTPYNLGTVFIHEMSHWARSLAIQHLIDTALIKKLPSSLHERDKYYLYDEAMSSVEGAYRQLSMRNDLNRVEESSLPMKDNSAYGSFTDLNLYNKNGNLAQLWESSVLHEGINFGTNFRRFFSQNFLNPSNEKYALEIFKLTERVYLGDESANAETVLKSVYESSEARAILDSPLEWLLTLDIHQIKQLNEKKKCEFNSRTNPGGEGVGLDDDELNLNNSDLRTCLKPIKDM